MKYFGEIGFSITEETPPDSGIWVERLIKKKYCGDILQKRISNKTSNDLNDDLEISHRISIIADEFAYSNFHRIICAAYMGANWKISSVEVKRPRLILTLGGVYNEPQT